MRAFIAIELPADLRRRLGAEIGELRRTQNAGLVRWSDPETVHLTLKFIGEIDDNERRMVQRVLDEGLADQQPFAFHVGGGLGCFPNWSRPRVFWIGVNGDSGRLAKTNAIIERGMTETGFEAETRTFHPHLTIGRIKRGAGRRAVALLSESLRSTEFGTLGTVQVTEISLMESDLRPSGAVHSRVYTVELGTES